MRRARLVQELEAAVAAEQYERAARIRDRLHQLDSSGTESKSGSAEAESKSEGKETRS